MSQRRLPDPEHITKMIINPLSDGFMSIQAFQSVSILPKPGLRTAFQQRRLSSAGCAAAGIYQRTSPPLDLPQHPFPLQKQLLFAPKPAIRTCYATGLPKLFQRIGSRTDMAIRDHLITTFGVVRPWPR